MEKREKIHFTDLVRTGGARTILPDELISAQAQGLVQVNGKHPTGRLNVSLTPSGYEAALSFSKVEAEILARFARSGVRRFCCYEQTLVEILQKRGLLFVGSFGNSDFPVRTLSPKGQERLASLRAEIS